MENIEVAWLKFRNNPLDFLSGNNYERKESPITIPKCGELKISTKTMISYLNMPINLNYIFWKIKIIDYYSKDDGAI